MKVIIFGCNGYIGRHLTKYLNENKFEIFGYDINEATNIDNIEYKCLNITNHNLINEIDFNVNYVLFFSGKTGTINAFEEYKNFIDINEIGLLNVLSSMRSQNSTARFIFPSSRLVYKGIKNCKLTEESPKEFKTIYALNKWNGEQLIMLFQQYFNIKYTIFRIGVPYGNLFNDNYSYGTIGFFLNNSINKINIELYGDGLQRRTFTHVIDICTQIYMSFNLNECENNIYNIIGEDLSLLEVAKEFNEKYKNKTITKDFDELSLKIESGDTIFDSTKLQSVLNYTLLNKFKDNI